MQVGTLYGLYKNATLFYNYENSASIFINAMVCKQYCFVGLWCSDGRELFFTECSVIERMGVSVYTRLRTLLATASVIGLACASLTVAAHAEDNPHLIKEQNGSITIHKRSVAGGVTVGDPNAGGEALDSPAGEALSGAEFNVRKVLKYKQGDAAGNDDVVVTTVEGLKRAAALTVNDLKSAQGALIEGLLGQDNKQITAETTGIATFTNLATGVYYVEETRTPAGHVPSQPFLVYLPMTAKNNQGWNYNVHVYPKNSTVKITKTVKDADVHAAGGDGNAADKALNFVLDTDIPAVPSGGYVNRFNVVDKLDTKLDHNSLTAKVELLEGIDNLTQLDESHYTLNKGNGNDQPAYVSFNKKGLTELSKQVNKGKKVRVTFTVKVKADTIGTITNAKEGETDTWADIGVTPPGPDTPPGDGVPPNEPTPPGPTPPPTVIKPETEVQVKYGEIVIKKKGEGDDSEGLDGATFEFYECTRATEDAVPVLAGEKLRVSGKTDWTTATDAQKGKGHASIKGVHISTLVDNVVVESNGQKTYCLVETVAPAGYELLPAPYWVGSITETTKDVAIEIVNLKSDKVRLPNTGGAGIIAFGIVGLAVIGAGIFAARRNKDDES